MGHKSEYNPGIEEKNIAWPLPPEGMEARTDMEIYARFMRHLRHVPHSATEIKILSAIQFTADMLDASDALVAKCLVDMGLRAPRRAFPVSFLNHVDDCLMRSGWEVGGPTMPILALRNHWDQTGEDRFAGFKRSYAIVEVGGCV